MLPKEIAKMVPKTHLMSETEWRALGVQQSQGWSHYMMHEPGNNLDLGKIKKRSDVSDVTHLLAGQQSYSHLASA